MSFNFGGPAMGGGSATEAVASRENRDIELRGGDVHYTQGVGLNGATATLVTAKSAGGRTYRDYLQIVDDRNNRIYVDATTGVSVLSGAKDTLFDELKRGDAPTELAVKPIG